MTRKVGIVERLGDLARFYLMERPDGAPLSQSECDEIVSELSGAATEITRLRAALAQRTEECARVADEMAVLAQYLASATEIDPLREQRIAESAQSLSIAAAIRSITP